MTARRPALLILVSALLSATLSVRSEPVTDVPKASKDTPKVRKPRHALLVAVTYYEHLAESKHLKGPANDTELMYKLLVEKLDFSPEQIMILSEKAGKAKGKDFPADQEQHLSRVQARLAQEAKPRRSSDDPHGRPRQSAAGGAQFSSAETGRPR